jgi:hypothetical protein
MTAQEMEDARWAHSIGVSLTDEPYPVVAGERYAGIVSENDRLTTLVHGLQAENEFLRAQIRGVKPKICPTLCTCPACVIRKCSGVPASPFRRPLNTVRPQSRVRARICGAICGGLGGFSAAKVILWLFQ